MELRRLNNTDLEVSPIALGCAAMGGDDAWGVVDDSESIAAVQTALDLGVNLVDTAPFQGDGHSEQIVGKAIRGRRDRVLVSTKCGLVPDERDPRQRVRCLSRDSIRRECEASLQRLCVETIDLYQCQYPDPDTPIAETMEAMARLREEGKIRVAGLSDYGTQPLAEARRVGTVSFLQASFSMLKRHGAQELIPYCQEYRIPMLAHGCLARGLLTGKFDAHSTFEGVRAHKSAFLGERYVRNLKTIDQLRAIARDYGKTVGQLALNWVIHHPGVTAAVVGAKRASQVQENVGAVGWCIREADLPKIGDILHGNA